MPPSGRPQKFFQGAKTTFCLSVSDCWRCNTDWRTQNALPLLCHKENAQCYDNSCKQGSISENLHRANLRKSVCQFFLKLRQIIYFRNTGFEYWFSKCRLLPAFAKLAVKYQPGRWNTGHLATLLVAARWSPTAKNIVSGPLVQPQWPAQNPGH